MLSSPNPPDNREVKDEVPVVEHIIQKVTSEPPLNPIVAIDLLLEGFAAERHNPNSPHLSRLLGLLCQSILRLEEAPLASAKSDPIAEIFGQNRSQQLQRMAAISFLRLLACADRCFKEVDFRVKAFNLFDTVLSADVYPQLGVHPKQQTYEKESRLRDAVPVIQEELSTLVMSFNSLDMLANFRKTFMQKFNSNLSKAIIWPFLPPHLLDIRLDQLFGAVEEYLEERGPRMLEGVEKARDVLATYSAEAEGHGTSYSYNLLARLAHKLSELILRDFEESPISKPAAMTLRKTEKKYALSLPGARFNLVFALENAGPGHAFDVYVKVTEVTDLIVQKEEQYLGHLGPTSVLVEFPVVVISAAKSSLTTAELRWTNFDRNPRRTDFIFEFEGQKPGVDWSRLSGEDPYNLEPVTTEEELVDRREILDRLLSQAQAESLGSSYIFGQKRVGKTSVVKTLKTRLAKRNLADFLVVYVEGGDYIHPDPIKTIENLGRRLCTEIQEADPRFAAIEIPKFDGALSPLAEFLNKVIRIAPSYRILFVLDEFDELPIDLYRRGSVGDAFFLTLRSISGKASFGFILVGGEKMAFIISSQGDALNKFRAIAVDYFEKEKHWSDFQELVRRPTADWLEFSDEALAALYDQAAGNPYFTKLICNSLFELMVDRRDCHVTRGEVQEATRLALQTVASNSFQHFWEDGIFVTGDRAEEVSVIRRRVLLVFAETLRQQRNPAKDTILALATRYGLPETAVLGELREFERRGVLTGEDGGYKCTVPFFGRWLAERGIREIITTFADLDLILETKRREEEAYIHAHEIVRLIENWGTYKGRHVAEERVRAWLSQFGENTNQRLMFRILQNVKYYTADNIRSKMKEAHGIVIRGLGSGTEPGKRKRSDILVSYLDSPGKSGAYYAKLYADENQIYYENVIERGLLGKTVGEGTGLQAVVFVDDLIGSGRSVCSYFEKLARECKGIIDSKGLTLFFIAIAGFQDAQRRIESFLNGLGLSVSVHICDPLDESAKCFSDRSRMFPDPDDREKAKGLAYRHGSRLVRNNPLGYGDSQAAIVFEVSCPNNCLPILWAEGKDWMPLFKRI